MAIPDYQKLMLPLLKFTADQEEHSVRQAFDAIAEGFKLTDAEIKELLPSGQQEVFNNRVGWARTYLVKAGLLEQTRRGYFKITKRGLDVLKQNHPSINLNFLNQFDEFRAFRTLRKAGSENQQVTDEKSEQGKTPAEIIEGAYRRLKDDLASDLLQQIKKSPPSLFENIVVDLLVKMGYGGSRADAGKAIGRTGDEGVDGVINEDRLGLEMVYIQAKRWENTVGRPDVQSFAGALQGKHARKGVFMTTSGFSEEAKAFVKGIESKIILIDGNLLADLMIEYNVGLNQGAIYQMKKIDSDYFLGD
ncbi:MAG: restriction endonuclease [Dehalococcoidia bacterium]|nr:restriction endonuclease [Dehalococcoidia bacterium]